jgi:hypothetical protein
MKALSCCKQRLSRHEDGEWVKLLKVCDSGMRILEISS